jgi:hypothetical protein
MARKRETDSRVLWLTCEECGAPLARTESGFIACPFGHGKLREVDQRVQSESDLFSRRCVCGADLGNDPSDFCSEDCREESLCES